MLMKQQKVLHGNHCMGQTMNVREVQNQVFAIDYSAQDFRGQCPLSSPHPSLLSSAHEDQQNF